MAAYYIKTGGSDSADGLSEGNAWATIGKVNAMMGSFSAGDTISFNGGDTFSDANLAITCQGTSGNQITFGSYGSGRPRFSGRAVQCGNGNGYITVDNLEIYNTAGDGITFYKSNGWQYDMKITDCLVHNAGNVGIFIQSIDDYLIDNCECYECYNGNIYVYGSDYPIKNGIISNCTSYDAIQNDGISIHEGDSLEACGSTHLIKDCVCYGNAEEGFDVSDGSDVTVQDCEAYGDAYAGFILEGKNAVMVNRCIARDGNHGIHVGQSNATIQNCLIYDNGYCPIYVEPYSASTGLKVYHNTLVHPASGNSGAIMTIYNEMTGITVTNNIFVSKQSTYPTRLVQLEDSPAAMSATFDYNCYYHPGGESGRFYAGGSTYSWTSWVTTLSQDANGAWGDPVFDDQDNDDYHIQTTSPCKDTGSDVGVTDDYDKNTRPVNTDYDIGAFEFGGENINVHVSLQATTATSSLPGITVTTDTGDVEVALPCLYTTSSLPTPTVAGNVVTSWNTNTRYKNIMSLGSNF